MNVSAVIPTRGDVDLAEITEHLRQYPEIDDINVVVGNTPYNRYLAVSKHDIIYTQDDDCITDLRPILDAYEPGVITNAMTPEHAQQYPGRETLLGFGCLFDKSMIGVLDEWEHDELFYREADRIFAIVHPHKTAFPEIRLMPWATAPNRLYRQPEHLTARDAMRLRVLKRTGIRA